MEHFFDKEGATRMGKALGMLVLFVSLYAAMKFVNEVKTFSSIGVAPSQTNTIDVSGSGDAFAIPDVATLAFSVEQKDKTIAQAQDVVTKKVSDAIGFLKTAGIAEKDIKTINYSAYPEYDYSHPCTTSTCVTKQPALLGYTVTQSIAVKIRDVNMVGKVVEGLAQAGITGITNTDFTVDDPDTVQAEARKQAIAEAEAKAKILAKDLGVRLVRIARFTENNGGGYPTPMYAKDMAYGMGGASATSAQLPAGESKYTSNVTITYEIR